MAFQNSANSADQQYRRSSGGRATITAVPFWTFFLVHAGCGQSTHM
jgi:hypothetical protein